MAKKSTVFLRPTIEKSRHLAGFVLKDVDKLHFHKPDDTSHSFSRSAFQLVSTI
jgi:hypothetical protein